MKNDRQKRRHARNLEALSPQFKKRLNPSLPHHHPFPPPPINRFAVTHNTAGTTRLNTNAHPGASCPAAPIPANRKPIGNDPQANAGTNRPNGIRTNPAVHANTSGNIGNDRDNAIIHPPPCEKSILPFSKSKSPSHLRAVRSPNNRPTP
jgi:hypothetical protein